MRLVRVTFENLPGSPYSQSASPDIPMLDRESHDDYNIRTWRDQCTVNAEGIVCIPAMAFKQAIDTAAFKVGMKVPNRRGATFRGFFESGFFCNANVPIANGKPLTKEDAVMQKISANSDGRRGSGKRVPKRFPEFPKYHGVADFTIVDDIITPSAFEHHFNVAGLIVGLGRFRPQNGGTYGRFRATNFEWQDFHL